MTGHLIPVFALALILTVATMIVAAESGPTMLLLLATYTAWYLVGAMMGGKW